MNIRKPNAEQYSALYEAFFKTFDIDGKWIDTREYSLTQIQEYLKNIGRIEVYQSEIQFFLEHILNAHYWVDYDKANVMGMITTHEIGRFYILPPIKKLNKEDLRKEFEERFNKIFNISCKWYEVEYYCVEQLVDILGYKNPSQDLIDNIFCLLKEFGSESVKVFSGDEWYILPKRRN